MSWAAIQDRIDACRICEQPPVRHLCVPVSEKRHPSVAPPVPTRIYFVSVAPPWGGVYFWDEAKLDGVRGGLFDALGSVLGKPVTRCQEFHDLGFHLSPAVKCPSQKAGKDHEPLERAIRNCRYHLLSELEIAKPERVLALGQVPFKSLSVLFSIDAPKRVADFHGQLWWVLVGGRKIPFSGTYFPGNDRHRGFHHIATDIARILSISPAERSE